MSDFDDMLAEISANILAGPPPDQNEGVLGDLGTDIKSGLAAIPSAITGLADIPSNLLFGESPISKGWDYIGEATGFQPSKYREELRKEYSPGRQEALRKFQEAEGFGGKTLAALQNPSILAGAAVESVPLMLAGGALGRLGHMANLVKTGAGAGALGEGAIAAGMSADELIGQGVDPRLSALSGLTVGAGTGLIAKFGGSLAEKAGFIDPDILATGLSAPTRAVQLADKLPFIDKGTLLERVVNAGGRIGGGAIAEGVLQEAPQSALETVVSNLAQGQPLGEGLAESIILGTGAGGVMGGAVNMFRSAPRDNRIKDDTGGTVPTQAELNQAIIDATFSSLGSPEDTSTASYTKTLKEQFIGPLYEDMGSPAIREAYIGRVMGATYTNLDNLSAEDRQDLANSVLIANILAAKNKEEVDAAMAVYKKYKPIVDAMRGGMQYGEQYIRDTETPDTQAIDFDENNNVLINQGSLFDTTPYPIAQPVPLTADQQPGDVTGVPEGVSLGNYPNPKPGLSPEAQLIIDSILSEEDQAAAIKEETDRVAALKDEYKALRQREYFELLAANLKERKKLESEQRKLTQQISYLNENTVKRKTTQNRLKDTAERKTIKNRLNEIQTALGILDTDDKRIKQNLQKAVSRRLQIKEEIKTAEAALRALKRSDLKIPSDTNAEKQRVETIERMPSRTIGVNEQRAIGKETPSGLSRVAESAAKAEPTENLPAPHSKPRTKREYFELLAANLKERKKLESKQRRLTQQIRYLGKNTKKYRDTKNKLNRIQATLDILVADDKRIRAGKYTETNEPIARPQADKPLGLPQQQKNKLSIAEREQLNVLAGKSRTAGIELTQADLFEGQNLPKGKPGRVEGQTLTNATDNARLAIDKAVSKLQVFTALKSVIANVKDAGIKKQVEDLDSLYKLNKRLRISTLRRAANKILDDIAQQDVEANIREKSNKEIDTTKATANYERAWRTVTKFGDQLEKAQTLQEVATAFAEVQTAIPDNVKSAETKKLIDQYYEELQFGEYEEGGKTKELTVPVAKKRIAALQNKLVMVLDPAKAIPFQKDMFKAVEASAGRKAKRAKIKKLSDKELAQIDRTTARRLHDWWVHLIKEGKQSPKNAMKVILHKMRAAKLRIPDQFITEETLKYVKELNIELGHIYEELFDTKTRTLIGKPTVPNPNVESDFTRVTTGGLEEYRKKVEWQKSKKELDALTKAHEDAEQSEFSKPKKKKTTAVGPNTALAIWKIRTATESFRNEWKTLFPSIGVSSTIDTLQNIADAVKSVNYPEADAVQYIVDAYKAKRIDFAKAKEQTLKHFSKFKRFVNDPNNLVAIGGKQVQYEIGGDNPTPEQLLEREGFNEDAEALQDYITTMPEAQVAIALASDIDTMGRKAKFKPGDAVSLTAYMGKTPEYITKDTYGGELTGAQVEGVNLALNQLIGGVGKFLLGDSTGFGKTRQILAIADQMVKKTGRPAAIFYTGKTKGPMYDQFIGEAQKLGIDTSKIDFFSYKGEVDQSKFKLPTTHYSVKLMDEAQNIKNKSTVTYSKIDNLHADSSLYATATAADDLDGMTIYADLLGVSVDALALELGYVKSGKGFVSNWQVAEGRTHIEADIAMAKLMQQMGNTGLLTRRQFMPNATPERVEVSVSDEANALAEQVLDLAEGVADQKNITNALSMIGEYGKQDAIIAETLKAIKAGQKVVVMVDRVVDTTFHLKAKGKAPIDITVPSIVPALEKALNKGINGKPIPFVPFYGNKTSANPADFQDGDAQVIITTPEKGGAGLNLDDTVGDKPRTMILAHFPYTAIEMMQMFGRIDRYSTASKPTIKLLVGNSVSEIRSNNILRRKMRTFFASSLGIPKAPDYLGNDAYTIRYGEPDKFKRRNIFVSLNTDQSITRALAPALSKYSKDGFQTGRNEYEFTTANWIKFEPQLVTALDAFGLLDNPAKKATTVIAHNASENAAGNQRRVHPFDKHRFNDASLAGIKLREKLRAAPSSGLPLNNVIDSVIKDLEKKRGALHRFIPLLRRLKQLNLNAKVYDATEELRAENKLGKTLLFSSKSYDGVVRSTIGLYLPTYNADNPDLDLLDIVGTFVHEVIHAAQAVRLIALKESNDPLYKEALTLYEYAKDNIPDKYKLWTMQGFKNIDEFFAEANSNLEFQDLLARIPYKRTGKSVWDKFVWLVKHLLGLSNIGYSTLDEAIKISNKLNASQKVQNQLVQNKNVSRILAEEDAKAKERISKAGIELADAAAAVTETLQNAAPVADGVINQLRKNVKLPLSTLRQIVTSYSEYFNGKTNPLELYADLIHQKEKRTRDYQREGEQVYREWADMENANPVEGAELSAIMGEATVQNFVIGDEVNFDSDENKHLNPSARANYNELQARWKKLSSPAKDIYNQVRMFYADEWKLIVDLLMTNVVENAELPFGNYTAADFVGKSKKEVAKRLMTDFEAHDKEDAKLKKTVTTLIDDIASTNRQSKIQGDYFPLKRFGDYVVTVKGNEATETFGSMKEAAERKAEIAATDIEKSFDTIEEKDGRFKLTYYDYVVEFYETNQQAVRGRAKLQEMYPEATVTDVLTKEQYAGESKGLSGALIENVARRTKDPRMAAAIRAAFIQMMPETSIHKAKLFRSGTAGYSQDMKRAFAAHIRAASNYKAQIEYGKQLASAVKDIKEAVSASRPTGNQPILQAVANEISERDKLDVTEITPNKHLDNASNLGFIWYLLSPSYWAINATQPMMLTVPWLNANLKGGGAFTALSKAYSAIGPEIGKRMGRTGKAFVKVDREALREISDFLTQDAEGNATVGRGFIKQIQKSGKYSKKMRQEIIAMLNDIGKTGLIDMTFAADIRTAAEGREHGFIDSVTEWARVMPHLVEVMNRTTTAMAAYELARKTMSPAEATKFAENAVANTQFDYGAVNKPRYFNERWFKLARPVLMFMQHSQHMYYMLLRSIAQTYPAVAKAIKREKLTAAEKEQVQVGIRVFAGVTGTHALMAGAIGATFEPIKWAIGMVAWALSDPDDEEPWDYEVAVRRAMADMFGETMGDIISRGAPAALGMDLTSRLGLQNLAFFDTGRGEEGSDWLKNKAFGLFGPIGGMASNAFDSMVSFRRGDYYKGMEQMSPKLVRDAIRTMKLGNKGLLDASGKVIIPPDDISPLDLFYQSMGFSPAKISDMQQRRGAVSGAKRAWQTKRSRLMEQYFRLETAAERNDFRRNEIAAFNKAAPTRATKIYGGDLLKSGKARTKQQRDITRTGGLNLSRTEREFARYGEF